MSRSFLLALVTAACASGAARGQPPDQPGKSAPDPEVDKLFHEVRKSLPPPAEPTATPAGPTTRDAYDDALRAYYDHNRWSFRFRERVYVWQFWSSIVIFVVAIGVVVVGMYMSWLQFQTFYRRLNVLNESAKAVSELKAKAARTGTQAGPPPDEMADLLKAVAQQVDISASGVKVSSPVLSVVILALSLGFFYMYLRFVYPINKPRGSPCLHPAVSSASQPWDCSWLRYRCGVTPLPLKGDRPCHRSVTPS